MIHPTHSHTIVETLQSKPVKKRNQSFNGTLQDAVAFAEQWGEWVCGDLEVFGRNGVLLAHRPWTSTEWQYTDVGLSVKVNDRFHRHGPVGGN